MCADTTGSDPAGSDAPWHRWPDVCREIRRFSDIPIVMVTAKIKRSTACWGWKLAQMTTSANRQPTGSGSARQNHFAPLQTAGELQQQDAESPLIIDEGRFQLHGAEKCLT